MYKLKSRPWLTQGNRYAWQRGPKIERSSRESPGPRAPCRAENREEEREREARPDASDQPPAAAVTGTADSSYAAPRERDLGSERITIITPLPSLLFSLTRVCSKR